MKKLILLLIKKKQRDGRIHYKGHKFIEIRYRLKNSCDICNKSLWDFFNPPLALECECK